VAGPQPRWHDGITGLIGTATPHIQAFTRRLDVDAEVAVDRDAFARVPAEHRVDIDALLGGGTGSGARRG
jgi:hypothetical protein